MRKYKSCLPVLLMDFDLAFKDKKILIRMIENQIGLLYYLEKWGIPFQGHLKNIILTRYLDRCDHTWADYVNIYFGMLILKMRIVPREFHFNSKRFTWRVFIAPVLSLQKYCFDHLILSLSLPPSLSLSLSLSPSLSLSLPPSLSLSLSLS